LQTLFVFGGLENPHWPLLVTGSYGQVINGQHATSCYLSGRSD